MVNQAIKISSGIFVALALIMSGAYIISDVENTYYCESRDLVGLCDRTTATRCYFNNTYKVCSEGWKPITDYVEIQDNGDYFIGVYANGEVYSCLVTDNSINSYSKCTSQSNKEAYLGELL